MDRLPAPVDRSIGPALRELLDASPKAVRRALQDRRGAEGLDGGKRAKKEETRRLVSSLDALARFLTDFSALESSGDPATAHPVLDPLLERVVRPTAGRGSGASVARSSDRSTDEKKTALRLVAFLASPARTSLGERREDANDALRRATAVGQALARRCAPGPTERRARLAACVAMKHAAVHCRALPAATRAGAADALLATIRESERTRLSEADPPTRLAVAAVDAALAVTARTAIAAAEDGEDGDFDAAQAKAAREACAAVRGWWRAGSPALTAPAAALDEVVRAFDTVALWSARAAREKDDTGEFERRRWLARAWRDWAPLVAADGFLALREGPEPTPSAGEPRETRAVNGRDLNDLDLAPGAVRLARWLATAAAAAADDAAGVSGAGDRLRHALVAASLAVGQLGLADGADVQSDVQSPSEARKLGNTETQDAASVFRAHAAETLVPALRSRTAATQELGAALLRAALVPRASAGWGPEQTALLDGLLPLLEEAPEAITPGLASLAAALVAVQPGGAGRDFVGTLCVSVSPAARRNAVLVLGEALRAATNTRTTSRTTSFPRSRREDDDFFVSSLRALAPRLSVTSEKDASVRDAARAAVRNAPLRETVETCVARFPRLSARLDRTEPTRDDAFEAVLIAALRGRGAVVATRTMLETLLDERGVLFAEDASTMGAGVARAVETFAAWFLRSASAATNENDAKECSEKNVPPVGFDSASLLETARLVVDAALYRGVLFSASRTPTAVASLTAVARLVAELAPWIGAPPFSRVAFEAARDALREKPFSRKAESDVTQSESRPTEDDSRTGSVDPVDPVDPVAVAFKRLAPLLLLRATRADAWDDWADSASSSRRDADGFGRDAESANDDANDTKHAKDSSLGGLLLALTHASSDAPDDARRLAAELHGRVSDIGAAAARVAATESALDASRLGDARATALAALSGLASRGVDALGADSPSDSTCIPSVRDTHRRVFVRMATFAIRAAARATTDGSRKEENTKTEIAKTRAGGAETLARTIAAELAETRAAPAGGLGAGLGDGARTSATLDGVVAAVTGNPRAPAWARPCDGRAREEQKYDDFDFEQTERNPTETETETRVALADALTCAARVVVGIRDRALAEAFARATYPTLAAHASSRVTNDERETTNDERRATNDERKPPEASARAACFSTCAVAFALAATDVSRESAGRDEGLGATKDSDEARAHGERCRHIHKRAALAHARDLAAAAARALRDGAAAPATRVAAAGLATAMLAADDDALEVIARSGALDELRAALDVAARAEDVPPLADAARGLLGAMGA